MLMAPLARAGSIAALAVLLALALVPAWSGPLWAIRPPALDLSAPGAGPAPTPMDSLSASVSATPPAADLGQSITFTCTASGGTSPYLYAWTLGDGDLGTGPTVSHTYGFSGTYTATCTVTDVLLGIATASKSVVISPNPSVAASVNHNLAAPGTTLTFDASSSGGGGYSPFVTASDSLGGSKIAQTQGVTVTSSSPAPLGARVSSPRTAADVGQSITFTCTAGGGTAPYTYAWTLGDGNSASGSVASHAYQSTGSMSVTCTVTDATTANAAASTSVDISPSPAVTASANRAAAAPAHTYSAEGNSTPSVRAADALGASRSTALPLVSVTSSSSPPVVPLSATMSMSTSLPRVNESISLSGTGHGGAGGYACAWDFGDGRTSTGCTTSHAWRTAGHFVVNLSLGDSGGNQTWQNGSVDVQSTLGPPGGPLTVSIATSRSLAGVNETVFLVATGGGGSGGYLCSWDFADGNFGTGCSVSYAWNLTGAYNVTLTLTDSSGNNATAAQTIEVVTALAASFEVGPSPAILGETGQLVAHPSGGVRPHDCTWDVEDASQASGCTTSHAWKTKGRFVIWLFVNDSMGQYDAVSKPLGVESSGLFGLPAGLDLVVLAAPVVVAALGIHLWNVWRNRDPIPQGLDSVEASVLSTLVGNVKRLSRWRPGRGARDRRSSLPGEESGPKAEEGRGSDDHQDPVQ